MHLYGLFAVLVGFAALFSAALAIAAEACPGNPKALGVSRILDGGEEEILGPVL